MTTRYGGDTTCISIETERQLLIIDAGTGLRLLGLEMEKRPARNATFFFTHTHWDHIQGFPFFSPAFNLHFSFDLYGPASTPEHPSLEQSLRGQQEGEKFPVQLQEMKAGLYFHPIHPQQSISLGDASNRLVITAESLNHPGGCLGYRIEEFRENGTSAVIAIATDTEHFPTPSPAIQKLATNADILLYDAQYTESEYTSSKKGWGHSTWEAGMREALAANAKTLLLTHHDPLHDDAFIANLEKEAQSSNFDQNLKILAASQFQEFIL